MNNFLKHAGVSAVTGLMLMGACPKSLSAKLLRMNPQQRPSAKLL